MPTALVVDDSEVDRRLIGGLLEKETSCEVEYAANGAEALGRIRKGPVDIVLTDLQMPEIDGLQLVRTIRSEFADIPVILITGKGSEELATEALEQGAASYVPKSRLAEILPETVDDVLAVVRADRGYASLIDCMTRNELSFVLPNDPAMIDPLVDLVQQMVASVAMCDGTDQVRTGIALEQALMNALLRGNLLIRSSQLQRAREGIDQDNAIDIVGQRSSISPYRERRIFVDVKITKDEARITVRDEGTGFDTSTVPAAGDASALEREGGRGLVLMRTFMDELMFNDAGNEVTMIKRYNRDDESK